MSGLGSGLVNLFKGLGKGIGNAADNFLLSADAKKAIEDEVIKKFQPRIDRFSRSESKRADTIKELGDKLTESKDNWKKARDDWKQQYDAALAAAKNQRQTDIANYDAKLKGYNDAVSNAERGRQNIWDQLYDQEAQYDPSRTLYTDVKTGNNYVLNPITNDYVNITKLYPTLSEEEAQALSNRIQNFGSRLFDSKSKTVINVFDKSAESNYGKYGAFNAYKNRVQSSRNADLRDADSKVTQANDDLSAWKTNNPNQPQALDETLFESDYRRTNKLPNEYSFNGQTYTKKSDLDQAYNQAINHLQTRKNYFKGKVSDSISERDAEIAKRIQDAKDIKKAKSATQELGLEFAFTSEQTDTHYKASEILQTSWQATKD